MQWMQLIGNLSAVRQSAGPDVDVRGVQYDSRRVGAGDVFVAMRGGTTDGNRFVEAALKQGAVAVVTDSPEVYAALREKMADLAVALVGPGPTAGRRALAEASAAVFGEPQNHLKLSAVTGTNGKTTTAFLLEQMLASAGRKSVLLGTIETHVAGIVRPSEQTTPESRDALALFAEGVRAGCTEAVMEMSSHALDQERVWGLPVDVAIFTNLTQDHLDYHGTMEAYAAAKAKLFAGVGAPPPRVAVINADDAEGARWIASGLKPSIMSYGIERGEYRAEDISLVAGRTSYEWHTPQGTVSIETSLTGRVNVYNVMAASCASLARGLSLEEIVEAAHHLSEVPGRFQVVPGSFGAGFTVVVDYAHTDDALKNLIALARDLVKPQDGRVITLFGCGGDRDRSKRPKMGRVAAQGSDLVIVTSDNPRSEPPQAIIDEVMQGVHETDTACVVEVDRQKAIAIAIHSAVPGDIVLLAGKGHEKVQIFADGPVPFDDVEEAAAVLRGMLRSRREALGEVTQ
jgi:UDP-N-acetylmuramoyl-L-alanyl-D-glutamate--2,6-diaminopimelate ligase